MNNKVNLTDDELSVIQAALNITIMSHEKYILLNGEEGLDKETKEAFQEMKTLQKRLNLEYFK